MSACRNDFAKRKGNVPPTACNGAKCRNTPMVLTLAGDKWYVGGE